MEDDGFDDASQQMRMIRHLDCGAQSVNKRLFDAAIAAGNTVPCPGCGLEGRKDGMCTHMTCQNCGTDWCYLCATRVEELDMAPRTEAASSELIYGHNQDWQTNPRRCPIYMSSISEVDPEWEDVMPKGEEDNDD